MSLVIETAQKVSNANGQETKDSATTTVTVPFSKWVFWTLFLLIILVAAFGQHTETKTFLS